MDSDDTPTRVRPPPPSHRIFPKTMAKALTVITGSKWRSDLAAMGAEPILMVGPR